MANGGLTQDQTEALILTNNIANTLALVGIIFFVYLYRSSPSQKPPHVICIGHLMFADFLYVIANFSMNFNQSTALCNLDGVMRQLSQILSVCWASLLAYISYSYIVRNKKIDKYFNLIVIIIYAVNIIIALLPFTHIWGLSYGHSLIFCWMVSDEMTDVQFLVLNWVTFYGIIWVAFIFLTYCYLKTYSTIRQYGLNPGEFKRILVYPLIMVIAFLPSTIDGFYLQENNNLYWLALIHFATQHSIGLWNGLVFGYTRYVEKRISIARTSLSMQHKQMKEMESSKQEDTFDDLRAGDISRDEELSVSSSIIEENKFKKISESFL